MNTQTKELFNKTKQYFNYIFSSIRGLEDNAVSIDDCIDTVYCIREVTNYLDQITKELNNLSDEMQSAVFVSLTARGKKSKATDYCTATTKSTTIYPIPSMKKDAKTYTEFMLSLGIPVDAITKEYVRPHWPGIMNLCNELLRNGDQLPPGVETTKGTSSLGIICRKKQEIC